jgi:hypothetical protein
MRIVTAEGSEEGHLKEGQKKCCDLIDSIGGPPHLPDLCLPIGPPLSPDFI